MGQKVNPTGFRLSVNRDWRSRWYASSQEFPSFLHSDLKIRNYVKKKLQFAAVSKIVIERAWNSIRVTIHTARPGIVIGRKGAEIEKITEEISKMAEGKQVKIDIQEIKTPELDAQLVSENVALQIERRIAYRRAMKKAVQTAMDFGAEGIRLRCSGRLNGAEISRSEWYREGKVPLHTLRTQLEAARVALTRNMKRKGKLWTRIFPDKSVTGRPPETRMGKGKGQPEYWVATVRPGNILFELDGVPESVARESLRLAADKLPV